MGDKWPGDASPMANELTKVDVVCETESIGEFRRRSVENNCTIEADIELEYDFGDYKNLREFECGGNIRIIEDETGQDFTSSMGRDKVSVQSEETNIKSRSLPYIRSSAGELPVETLAQPTGSRDLVRAQVCEGREVTILQGDYPQELEVGTEEAVTDYVQPSDGIGNQSEVDPITETSLVDSDDLSDSEVSNEIEIVETVQQTNLSCANEPEARLMENKDLQVGKAEGTSSILQVQFSKPSCEEPVAPTATMVGDGQSAMVTNNVEPSGLYDEKQLTLNEKLHKTCEVM